MDNIFQPERFYILVGTLSFKKKKAEDTSVVRGKNTYKSVLLGSDTVLTKAPDIILLGN